MDHLHENLNRSVYQYRYMSRSHYGNQGIKIQYHPGTKLHPKHVQGIIGDAKKQKSGCLLYKIDDFHLKRPDILYL